VFVTAPREDELPPGVSLPVFRVKDGQVIAEMGSLVG